MQQIRPYDLIAQSPRSQVQAAPRGQAHSFQSFLEEDLAASEFEEEAAGGGADLDYLAAELACRQNLLQATGTDGLQQYPVQSADFLRNQRRPASSPMMALRLSGVIKAASLQHRNGVRPPGTP